MNEQQSLRAAIHEEVRLFPHDPAWPQAYAAERLRLLSVLPGVFIDVQHVGSTAVPGLAAKPIIDILASVTSMAVAESVIAPLCAVGYTTSAEYNATLSDRKWLMRWADGRRTHHLHVAVHDGPVWREWLRFRDALRAQPALAARYAEWKADCAGKHPRDREAYTQAKAEFIRAVTKTLAVSHPSQEHPHDRS
ncbi:GrpB family protein [Hylemonella gracilis]|jgi:GrpB-like predicted nucleotidyltransferase (UPF0157 family)|uniref:GrpB family protein n=1 Tax=Hylemonella gracilis TaxID=80880 RepID=A0A4V1A260_9BURK|nr:GrpB family protein [Hylemonella gracilis]QBK04919.1 GrpB family protein [Hylemonella gracilis]